MSYNNQIARWEPLRSLAAGSISGTYANVGTSFANSAVKVLYNNLTDATITISTNGGLNDHLILGAGQAFVDDIATDRVGPNDQLLMPRYTQVMVKGSPTTGSFYLSVQYASQT